MKTAVVILNWNGKEFLERFLPGLAASAAKAEDARVIVADNASTDGSMEMMREKFPDISTMSFSKNWGFTGGYNRALMEMKAEYFVLINSDIEVPEDWLNPLVKWMDTHQECGMCAPKLHGFDHRDRFEYAGAAGGYIDKFGYPFCRGRVMKRVEQDRGQYDRPAEVFWATGACLMVRASVYKELGGLDDRFFAHMEEIDLCWRAQLAGYTVCVVPESTVYHIGGGTLPNNSPWKLYLNYRNNLLMLRNNLARTEALALYRNGMKRKESVDKGMKRAERRIVTRIFLDILSSLVYLMTFRISYWKSVMKAHKDFFRIGKAVNREGINLYLKNYGRKAEVKGIYGRWIIPAALFSGNRIFRKISRYFAGLESE